MVGVRGVRHCTCGLTSFSADAFSNRPLTNAKSLIDEVLAQTTDAVTRTRFEELKTKRNTATYSRFEVTSHLQLEVAVAALQGDFTRVGLVEFGVYDWSNFAQHVRSMMTFQAAHCDDEWPKKHVRGPSSNAAGTQHLTNPSTGAKRFTLNAALGSVVSLRYVFSHEPGPGRVFSCGIHLRRWQQNHALRLRI